MAVQAKHTVQPDWKVGPALVRDPLGTVQTHGFNAGLLIILPSRQMLGGEPASGDS